MRLSGKKILLGVSGSIAAYKAAEIIRILVKEGADVQVIMTESAKTFITPLTLGTLSRRAVLSAFSDPESGTWNNHVELGLWADAYLIAPASAHTLAKLADGYCEDLLSAVYLSSRCPVFLAPAMDVDMYAHSATRENIDRLKSFGNHIIGPAKGELASGLKGEGRLMEPDEICRYLVSALNPSSVYTGKTVLISAGPTRESIDPVRYISNHSTGKMGIALAEEFQMRGATVHLVSGPGVKIPMNTSIITHPVTTADEMFDSCLRIFPDADITVMAAAVADYAPAKPENRKMKKSGQEMTLALKPTRDILAAMGQQKRPGQVLVGFALETHDEIKFATSKLKLKNLDFIVVNSLKDPGAGFGSDTNKITIIDENSEMKSFDLKSKREVAMDILDFIKSKIK